jgi:hypothetical protein
MRLLLVGALLALGVARSGDDEPTTTATADGEVAPSSTPTTTPQATPTAEEAFSRTPFPLPDEWDEDAVWQGYLDGSRLYDECISALEIDCAVRVAVDEGVAQPGVAFIESYETVLVYFEELGVVDFGDVSWLGINMGRPEPVFLNGDFGLIYYGSLIPEDWQEADLSYAALTSDEADPFPWAEYSMLAETSTDSAGQHAVLETSIRSCRACPTLADLELDVAFTAEGSLSDVTVLPMRCESEVFKNELGQGPCNPDMGLANYQPPAPAGVLVSSRRRYHGG